MGLAWEPWSLQRAKGLVDEVFKMRSARPGCGDSWQSQLLCYPASFEPIQVSGKKQRQSDGPLATVDMAEACMRCLTKWDLLMLVMCEV